MNIQASDFKKFCFHLAVFLSIVFVLDWIGGTILKWLYFKQKHGPLYQVTYTFNKVTAPLLFVGSSRAHHHYIPRIFEDSLKMECYNTGSDGHYMFYYDAVLKCVLKRYNPKVIVLDILPKEFERSKDNYDRLSVLLPYYSSHPEIRDIIRLKSDFEQVKLFSAIYPYNSLLFTVLKEIPDNPREVADELKNKGFDPGFHGIFKKEKLKMSHYNDNADIDTAVVTAMESFMKECSDRKIKLFITVSPMLVKYVNQSKSVLMTKKIADKYNFSLWDCSQNPFFLHHHELFINRNHLNITGAKIFSKLIAGKLKTALNDPGQN